MMPVQKSLRRQRLMLYNIQLKVGIMSQGISIKLKNVIPNNIFPPDEFFEILNWCVVTCIGKWTMEYEEWNETTSWLFQFENEEDEAMFILRWL